MFVQGIAILAKIIPKKDIIKIKKRSWYKKLIKNHTNRKNNIKGIRHVKINYKRLVFFK